MLKISSVAVGMQTYCLLDPEWNLNHCIMEVIVMKIIKNKDFEKITIC